MSCPCPARNHAQGKGDCRCTLADSRAALFPLWIALDWIKRRTPEEIGLFIFFALWTGLVWLLS